MYTKIITNNWKAHPAKFLIIFVPVLISIILTSILFSLSAGLSNFFFNENETSSNVKQITVLAESPKLDFSIKNLIPKAKIDDEMLNQIKQIEGVKEVTPINTINGVSSLQIHLLGQWFQTDALLFGSPYELLKINDLPMENWQHQENEPYPAVVSSKLVDLYNLSFANTNNLPQITEENFIGQEINILLNKSTFFPTDSQSTQDATLKAKIVGFSPEVKMIGLTLPFDSVEEINRNYLNIDQAKYLEATVKVDELENLKGISSQIKELGLKIKTDDPSTETLKTFFLIVSTAAAFFLIIIILLSGLLISSMQLNKIIEKKKEIFILKAIGLNQDQVMRLYLTESVLLAFLASIIAIMLTLILIIPLEGLLQNQMSQIINKPSHFFIMSPLQMLLTIILSIIVAALFSLLPARKAAKMNPMEIVSG